MAKITCRFYGELNDFLPRALKGLTFESLFEGRESIKDKVESLGVPHTEVDVILIGGRSVGFDYILEDGDAIRIYPLGGLVHSRGIKHLNRLSAGNSRFIAEGNIRDVVKTMRGLGLDVVEAKSLSPGELIDMALNGNRVILSASRRLLKQKRVVQGIFVRKGAREEQIQKIVNRLSLAGLCKPFSRCLLCNTILERVSKERVLERIPPKTRSRCHAYAKCPSCDKLYWKGTHYQAIKAKVDRILNP